MRKSAVGSMSDWSGLLKDLFRQIDDGTITRGKLEAVVNNKIVYPEDTPDLEVAILRAMVRKTSKTLSRVFSKRIKVDPLPSEFTPENLEKWERYNLKPIFLPGEEIGEERILKDWVKPEKWFYQKIREGKIADDSAKLRRGWYLADVTPSVDYDNGIQVYPNDPFAPIIERLRTEKIGKYDKTPLASRFAIAPKNEWPIVLTEIAKELGLRPEQMRLERAIEFNAISNLYDDNRGKFNSWEWFNDPFGDSYRLCGGCRGDGGLAGVDCYSAGSRGGAIAGRPLASF